MIVFPKLHITQIEEQDYYPEEKVEFGKLYESSAPAFTRALKIFTLTIEALSLEDRQNLSLFYKDNQGDTFIFIEPETRTTYTVKFHEMDKLSYKKVPGKKSSTSITLKEVA